MLLISLMLLAAMFGLAVVTDLFTTAIIVVIGVLAFIAIFMAIVAVILNALERIVERMGLDEDDVVLE
jgi:uncharacterized membrane protein YqiK